MMIAETDKNSEETRTKEGWDYVKEGDPFYTALFVIMAGMITIILLSLLGII